jgi:hypothetical protein
VAIKGHKAIALLSFSPQHATCGIISSSSSSSSSSSILIIIIVIIIIIIIPSPSPQAHVELFEMHEGVKLVCGSLRAFANDAEVVSSALEAIITLAHGDTPGKKEEKASSLSSSSSS